MGNERMMKILFFVFFYYHKIGPTSFTIRVSYSFVMVVSMTDVVSNKRGKHFGCEGNLVPH